LRAPFSAGLPAAGAGGRLPGMAKPKPEIVDWLEEVFAPLGAIDARRLFGGWQLQADGRPFAVVLDGTLYFRVDAALRGELEALGARPFRYAKQGRTVTIGRFVSAPEADIDDEAALLGWAARALAGAEPGP
jgi:DNA transformation protein and related proteins